MESSEIRLDASNLDAKSNNLSVIQVDLNSIGGLPTNKFLRLKNVLVNEDWYWANLFCKDNYQIGFKIGLKWVIFTVKNRITSESSFVIPDFKRLKNMVMWKKRTAKTLQIYNFRRIHLNTFNRNRGLWGDLPSKPIR